MLAQDQQLMLRLIAEELGISKDTAHTIVRDDLGSGRSSPNLCRTSSQTSRKQNAWKPLETSFPGSIACGKHRHGRWDLVLPVWSRIKTAISDMVFTDFPTTKKKSSAKIQGQNTDCYNVSSGLGQSCTGLENGCCSTIMPLHTVWYVCANFRPRRW